jgi:hypothetical protein
LPDPRRLHALILVLMAAVALAAALLSALPSPWALGLWMLALGLVASAWQRQPVAQALVVAADGGLYLAFDQDMPLCPCEGWRRYGPWVLIDYRSTAQQRCVVGVPVMLLDAERDRQMRRMLARARPVDPGSV